jgi:hypothetical protein
VQPLFSRIRRSDPEMTIIRQIFAALTRRVKLRFDLPDDANDDEKQALVFGEQVLADLEGGYIPMLETLVSNVPFFGWGWFEILHGIRSSDWRPPDENDQWGSSYNDGLIGIRRLAWRDSSSFKAWQLDPKSGRLLGMVQTKGIGFEDVTLPLKNSLHVTFGDSNNPEGLSPLEAVWRLERIKYGLEVVQGIGFEHAAGYLDVKVEETLSSQDKALIKKAARAILTAQEGNYATWPAGTTGEVKDIPFAAGSPLLEAIKYYGILKLSIYNTQWVALSSTTGAGSYAAMDDSSSMFMSTYNAMIDGFIRQIDEQVFRPLYQINALAWPGMERRPRLTFDPIEKRISLTELGSFITQLDGLILGDDDIKAIRERSGFLPVAVPDAQSKGVKDKPAPVAPAASTAAPAAAALKPQDRAKLRSSFRAYLEHIRLSDPDTYKLISGKLKGKNNAR